MPLLSLVLPSSFFSQSYPCCLQQEFLTIFQHLDQFLLRLLLRLFHSSFQNPQYFFLLIFHNAWQVLLPTQSDNHTILSSLPHHDTSLSLFFFHGRLYHLDDGPSKGGWGAARSGQGNATYWLLAVCQGINTTGGRSETAQKAILETDPKCPITTLEEQKKDNEKMEKPVYS